jgi:hypothetical protein
LLPSGHPGDDTCAECGLEEDDEAHTDAEDIEHHDFDSSQPDQLSDWADEQRGMLQDLVNEFPL